MTLRRSRPCPPSHSGPSPWLGYPRGRALRLLSACQHGMRERALPYLPLMHTSPMARIRARDQLKSAQAQLCRPPRVQALPEQRLRPTGRRLASFGFSFTRFGRGRQSPPNRQVAGRCSVSRRLAPGGERPRFFHFASLHLRTTTICHLLATRA